MRLHFGGPPENKDFHPEEEGWHSIREPGPVAMQFMAIPVALLLFVLWGACLLSVLQDTAPLSFYGFRMEFRREPFSFQIDINALLVLLLIVPAHELLHAFAHPGWGTSSNSVVGLWLSRGLFYAHYEGEMSRNRFLWVFVAPLLILGVLPTLLIMMIPTLTQSLFWLSLLGTIFACGDLVGAGFIFFQVPHSAVVRNKGWKTYWKPLQ